MVKKKSKPGIVERRSRGSVTRCDICNKIFSTKGNLAQHLAIHIARSQVSHAATEVDEQSHSCDQCGKIFSQQRYLVAHKKRCGMKKPVLSNRKTHQCGLCGKIFSRLSHLQRHQLHHLQLKSYVCTICQRDFVQYHHLRRHIMSESHIQRMKLENIDVVQSVRPHHCPACSKAFATGWELQRHLSSVHPYAEVESLPGSSNGGGNNINSVDCMDNSNEEKFSEPPTFLARSLLQCKRCDARFDNDRHYAKHMEWHKGRRTHVCQLCRVPFQRRLELETHQAAKHGFGWMFECLECRRQFAQRTEIDRHLKRFHAPLEIPETPGAVRESEMSCTELVCKYCREKVVGVTAYHNHIAGRHYRKVYVDCRTTDEENETDDEAEDSQKLDERELTIQLVVDVQFQKNPIRRLCLGPLLPEWLLRLQPSYAMLDVDLTDDDKAFVAGESVVLQLPLGSNIRRCDVPKRTVRISV